MNENDLRDCFAMFAMLTQFFRADEDKHDAERCYQMADAMLEARRAEPKEEVGIVAAKPKRRTKSE